MSAMMKGKDIAKIIQRNMSYLPKLYIWQNHVDQTDNAKIGGFFFTEIGVNWMVGWIPGQLFSSKAEVSVDNVARVGLQESTTCKIIIECPSCDLLSHTSAFAPNRNQCWSSFGKPLGVETLRPQIISMIKIQGTNRDKATKQRCQSWS